MEKKLEKGWSAFYLPNDFMSDVFATKQEAEDYVEKAVHECTINGVGKRCDHCKAEWSVEDVDFTFDFSLCVDCGVRIGKQEAQCANCRIQL